MQRLIECRCCADQLGPRGGDANAGLPCLPLRPRHHRHCRVHRRPQGPQPHWLFAFSSAVLTLAHVAPARSRFKFTSAELDGIAQDPGADAKGPKRPRVTLTLTIDDAILQNQDSRTYLGVHWEMDSREGGVIGKEVRRCSIWLCFQCPLDRCGSQVLPVRVGIRCARQVCDAQCDVRSSRGRACVLVQLRHCNRIA